jgi:plasmid replication initiation protein
MKKNLKITKSNSLINASYRLSMNELRIILYGLSAINPMSDDFPLEYSFTKADIAEFYAVPKKNRKDFYHDIEKALTTKFWNREFTYYDEKRKQKVSNRWLITIRHGGTNPNLSYVYNPEIKDHLQQLSKRFTSYFLTEVSRMKSSFSIRLYEIAIMYLNASKTSMRTKFTIDLEELKEKLNLDGKYNRFNNFRSKVLDVAKKEIDEFTDISFNFVPWSAGVNQRVKRIDFIVSRKPKKSSPQPRINGHANASPAVSLTTLEKAKKIILDAGNQWDVYDLQSQFFDYVKQKGEPKNINGAFIGFVKKKVAVSL